MVRENRLGFRFYCNRFLHLKCFLDMAFDYSIRYATAHSCLGEVLIAATERGVCRITFDDTPEILLHCLEDAFPEATLLADDPAFSDRGRSQQIKLNLIDHLFKLFCDRHSGTCLQFNIFLCQEEQDLMRLEPYTM